MSLPTLMAAQAIDYQLMLSSNVLSECCNPGKQQKSAGLPWLESSGSSADISMQCLLRSPTEDRAIN